MTDEQKAAYVFASAVAALAEIEGMKAENQHRCSCGNSVAYGEDAFFGVIEKYDISQSTINDLFCRG